jgi:uncharacterized protein (TIGR02217 family)
MSFDEVQFSTRISEGSRGGPAFDVDIVTVDSQREYRNLRNTRPRHRYDVSYGVQTWAELMEIREFFFARRGALTGFRYQDWSDYTTAADGFSAPSATDQPLGTGDGTTTTFPLAKVYEQSGPSPFTRRITKPQAGTVLAAIDGTPTSAFTVDTSAGTLDFNTAPGVGEALAWGGRFDVPVRFEADAQNGLNISLASFNSGDIPSITLLELVEGDGVAQRVTNYGETSAVFVDEYQIPTNAAFIQRLSGNASGTVLLPDPTAQIPGGPYFLIVNAGSNAFSVETASEVVVSSVAADAAVLMFIRGDGETGEGWYGR